MATLQALTEAIAKRAAQNPRLGYKVKFQLDDGVIVWDGTVTPPVVGNENGPVDTTMKITSANLEKMLAGSLDPTMAYMTGKLKVEGSLGVAMKLSGMLGD